MTNIEWLNEKKARCERGIEFYQNKINLLERDLEAINRLLDSADGQPMDKRTAQ